MTRSRKKAPIVKDKPTGAKEAHARKYRRRNRQLVKVGEEPLDPREVTNPYDICDYIYRLPKDPKVKRK